MTEAICGRDDEVTGVAVEANNGKVVYLPGVPLGPSAVPFWRMAKCMKLAWLWLAVGLILNVMPVPQWPFCLQ